MVLTSTVLVDEVSRVAGGAITQKVHHLIVDDISRKNRANDGGLK